jgi:hypothetical protein
MALAGFNIDANIRIETAAGSGVSTGGGFVRVYNGANQIGFFGDYTMQQFDSANLGAAFGSTGANLANGMTDVEFFFFNNVAWSGTIFFDDIRIALAPM